MFGYIKELENLAKNNQNCVFLGMQAKRRVEVQEIDVGILMEREGVSRCMMDSAFPQGKFFPWYY